MLAKKNLLLVLVGVIAFSSAAYAYWTASGSGSGSGAVASSVSSVTVTQTTTLSPMYPGDSAQTLSGKFNNANSGSVYVGTITVSIGSVTKAGGAVAGTCDATDFTLAGAAMTVNADIPSGTAQGNWTGATIKFNDKGTSQDQCKGATVNLAYAVS